MSAAKHTPGPWEVMNSGNGRHYVRRVGARRGEASVAQIIQTHSGGDWAWHGNAMLLAAAPALADALTYVEENTEHEAGWRCGTADQPGDDGMVLCIKCVALNALRAAGRLP